MVSNRFQPGGGEGRIRGGGRRGKRESEYSTHTQYCRVVSLSLSSLLTCGDLVPDRALPSRLFHGSVPTENLVVEGNHGHQ